MRSSPININDTTANSAKYKLGNYLENIDEWHVCLKNLTKYFLQFKTGMWKTGAGENGDPTSVYNGEFFLSLCDKFHLLWSKAIKYVTGKF